MYEVLMDDLQVNTQFLEDLFDLQVLINIGNIALKIMLEKKRINLHNTKNNHY